MLELADQRDPKWSLQKWQRRPRDRETDIVNIPEHQARESHGYYCGLGSHRLPTSCRGRQHRLITAGKIRKRSNSVSSICGINVVRHKSR